MAPVWAKGLDAREECVREWMNEITFPIYRLFRRVGLDTAVEDRAPLSDGKIAWKCVWTLNWPI